MKTLETPLSPDAVYHITSIRKIGSILASGLNPNPERGREVDWQEAEKFLDDERPQSVIEKGISRRDAVYAHPDIDMVQSSDAMGTHHIDDQEDAGSIAVAIEIADPDKVLVCDAWLTGDVHRNIKSGDIKSASKYAREYWEQSVSLSDFRRFYTSRYIKNPYLGAVGAEHVRNEDAPENLPYLFLQPEVLVPGPVERERLEWAASNISDHDD